MLLNTYKTSSSINYISIFKRLDYLSRKMDYPTASYIYPIPYPINWTRIRTGLCSDVKKLLPFHMKTDSKTVSVAKYYCKQTSTTWKCQSCIPRTKHRHLTCLSTGGALPMGMPWSLFTQEQHNYKIECKDSRNHTCWSCEENFGRLFTTQEWRIKTNKWSHCGFMVLGINNARWGEAMTRTR